MIVERRRVCNSVLEQEARSSQRWKLLQSQLNHYHHTRPDGWHWKMKKWHKQLKTDIAMLAHNAEERPDILEVFCSPTSQLTRSAQGANLKAERWAEEDFDLSTPEGLSLAKDRLRELQPRRLWLSPECGPYSTRHNANQRTPQQREELRQKRELAFRMWQSCVRLAWPQAELGGTFYIEQPHRCMSWRL